MASRFGIVQLRVHLIPVNIEGVHESPLTSENPQLAWQAGNTLGQVKGWCQDWVFCKGLDGAELFVRVSVGSIHFQAKTFQKSFKVFAKVTQWYRQPCQWPGLGHIGQRLQRSESTSQWQTCNIIFFFSHAVRAMTALTVVQDCILFAHNSKEIKDLVRGGSKPNKQTNNKTQHPNQTKNHKQDNQPNRPQKLRSRR